MSFFKDWRKKLRAKRGKGLESWYKTMPDLYEGKGALCMYHLMSNKSKPCPFEVKTLRMMRTIAESKHYFHYVHWTTDAQGQVWLSREEALLVKEGWSLASKDNSYPERLNQIHEKAEQLWKQSEGKGRIILLTEKNLDELLTEPVSGRILFYMENGKGYQSYGELSFSPDSVKP